jgi:hypothetical protein
MRHKPSELECVICGAHYREGTSHQCPASVLDRIDRADRAQPLEPTGSCPPRSYHDRLKDGWDLLSEPEEEEMGR